MIVQVYLANTIFDKRFKILINFNNHLIILLFMYCIVTIILQTIFAQIFYYLLLRESRKEYASQAISTNKLCVLIR